MITGAHVVLYSKDAEADRAALGALLEGPKVDAGEGWMIFGLPPAEVAVHPAETGGRHEMFFLTADIAGARERLAAAGVTCGETTDEGWGVLARLTLPSGMTVGLYEPRHALARGAG